MSDPLHISNEMRAMDLKQRDWYDRLEPELQKKFSPYLMIRWGSAVQGSQAMQEYYVQATNLRLNRHFFSINASRHKKLLWLMATTVSPDMGSQGHSWIRPKAKAKTGQGIKMLREMYPDLRESELELLDSINDIADIKREYQDRGNQD